jgi:hypothetical protein
MSNKWNDKKVKEFMRKLFPEKIDFHLPPKTLVRMRENEEGNLSRISKG